MELLKNLEGMSADEQMTAVVELQKAAMKQLEEQKQVSIGKSAEMVIQGLKKIKSDFEAKFDSLNYDIQAKVANLKDGQPGIQGPKGDQGDRGLDGANGRDGRDGKDGRDGVDGVDGIGVRDAKIDFDGSLVISLTDGREINCGEVVSVDVAKQIQKVTHNIQTGAGGDSQTVLDAIAALQATIATYGTMATQNANNVAITGGTINNTVIGGTTPAAGTFTTLTATGQTSLGGVAGAEAFRAVTTASAVNYLQATGAIAGSSPNLSVQGSDTNIDLLLSSKGTSGTVVFRTNGTTRQAQISHTASAVNYVQVTGAATSNSPQISFTGSDAGVGGALIAKGNGAISFFNNGATTSRQFRVGAGVVTTAVNYINADGSATGNATQFQTLGTDTNIAMALRTSGTGAIDLAAGSSGVNISNGNTVTAVTRTAAGTGYTSPPTWTASAPTTAGGTQASGTTTLTVVSSTLGSGGTGYSVNDVLTVSGGTSTQAVQITVNTVSGGVIATFTVTTGGNYTVIPTNPVSVTGGTGSGATFNLTWGITSTGFVISVAGSGYVEQPTVTFSGGGGSGAAAYATVGSGTIVRSLGSTISFYTPAGEQARVSDSGNTPDAYVSLKGASPTSGGVYITAAGAVRSLYLSSGSGASIRTYTGGEGTNEQFRVAHTASAVNYVQVTGAATGAAPLISVQGSDANVAFGITSKGTSAINFLTNSGNQRQLQINHTASAVNYFALTGSAAGSAPAFSVAGSDTNIDLALTPKGTGNVRFGTYTGTISAITGYIEIKDSGGTVRRLAVVA
jgi:hypothetical protein